MLCFERKIFYLTRINHLGNSDTHYCNKREKLGGIMKRLFVVLFLVTFSVSAYALDKGKLELTADTDYKQTVWTAVKLPRLYSANILPANQKAALQLAQLNSDKDYVCQAKYYFGNVGFFNSDNERGIVMLYSLSDCKNK